VHLFFSLSLCSPLCFHGFIDVVRHVDEADGDCGL